MWIETEVMPSSANDKCTQVFVHTHKGGFFTKVGSSCESGNEQNDRIELNKDFF